MAVMSVESPTTLLTAEHDALNELLRTRKWLEAGMRLHVEQPPQFFVPAGYYEISLDQPGWSFPIARGYFTLVAR